jgi:hypothetical protein
MILGEQQPSIDFSVDQNNLYREEAITDLKVASIRILTPIKTDGTNDPSRKPLFFGHTQLMSPQGPIPIQSPLKAQTLEDAFKEFPEAMKKAMNELLEDLRKIQQEQMDRNQSRIITPR